MDEVIYSCVRGLDGHVCYCKLAMHANCFDEMRKSMFHDYGSMQNCMRNRSNIVFFDRLNSCCQHNVRGLCIKTDGAWWKWKKCCHQKSIGIYPAEFIICSKSFSIFFSNKEG